MRKARLLETPIIGILDSSYGKIEGIVIAEDSISTYIIITDNSKIDSLELIGLKSAEVSGLKDFWSFYIPTNFLNAIFTPYDTQSLTVSDLDKYKTTEVNELYDAYKEALTKFEDDLMTSLEQKHNNTSEKELSEDDKAEFREMLHGMDFSFGDFKSKKDVCEILNTNIRNKILLSFMFNDGADKVFRYIKDNRTKGTPIDIANQGFDLIKGTYEEKYNFEFI